MYHFCSDANIPYWCAYCAITMKYFPLCLVSFVFNHKLCNIKFITLREITIKNDRKLLYGHQCLLFQKIVALNYCSVQFAIARFFILWKYVCIVVNLIFLLLFIFSRWMLYCMYVFLEKYGQVFKKNTRILRVHWSSVFECSVLISALSSKFQK